VARCPRQCGGRIPRHEQALGRFGQRLEDADHPRGLLAEHVEDDAGMLHQLGGRSLLRLDLDRVRQTDGGRDHLGLVSKPEPPLVEGPHGGLVERRLTQRD
jgi:hypothetical protein